MNIVIIINNNGWKKSNVDWIKKNGEINKEIRVVQGMIRFTPSESSYLFW